MKTWEDCLRQAEIEIENDSDIFYDAMADCGQMPGNVKHTRWAINQVAAWIADDNGIDVPE